MFDDWVLVYPGTEYRFGPNDRDVKVQGWQFAGESFRTDDTVLPREDGLAFGEDFIEAGELSVDIIIDYSLYPQPARVRAALAWDTRTEFLRAWRADAVRRSRGERAELRIGGQIAIEGRPRRVVWDDTAQNIGVVKGTAYFVPAGTGVFELGGTDDGWREQTVSLVPPLSGGLVAPLIAPLSTSLDSVRETSFVVGGESPAWPIVTIRGPLASGAQFELTGRWEMPLNRSLGPFDVLRVDTRPGRRSMYLNDVPRNVLTSGAVPLASADLRPGPNEIALRGTSAEGTATASIRWRDTKESV